MALRRVSVIILAVERATSIECGVFILAFVIRHANRIFFASCHIANLPTVACLAVPFLFSQHRTNGTILEGEKIECEMCVLIFCKTLV